ncbi:hypothetical protein Fmac_008159 [Flemingia macrophylla]|uniref:Uncharacterized protein n=1 Tax=Flemingia macrophylla TaxID=520843 RepID=A0ABD1MWL7_9FABA
MNCSISPKPRAQISRGKEKSLKLSFVSDIIPGQRTIWLQNTLKYGLQRVWVIGYLKASRRSEVASSVGGSQSTSIDPVQEETLQNKSWFIAAGGLTNKGRLYGVGKVSPYYRVGDSFTQQTSSAHDMDKIYQHEEEVRQSREEAHQSREENSRLSRQFQSLFHVVLLLLPADAHNILQELNQQQQQSDQNLQQNDQNVQGDQQRDQQPSVPPPPEYADY